MRVACARNCGSSISLPAHSHSTTCVFLCIFSSTQDTEPFPTRNVLALLSASTVIFEHCSNCRSTYASTEHLCTLLAAPDMDVLAVTLRCIGMLVRRRNSLGGNKGQEQDLVARLSQIAQSWTGREGANLDLISLVSGKDIRPQQERLLTSLRLEVRGGEDTTHVVKVRRQGDREIGKRCCTRPVQLGSGRFIHPS